MSYPPRITDESVLARWMGHEVENMNGGVVTQTNISCYSAGGKGSGSTTRKGKKNHA